VATEARSALNIHATILCFSTSSANHLWEKIKGALLNIIPAEQAFKN